METCEAIVRRDAKVSWGCFLRPQGLTAEQMNLMARAGLTHIEFGSESFSDSVLDAFAASGPVTIMANACASGASAIGHGWECVRYGVGDRV